MSVIAVIPARFASTRLPAKPLLRETGRTLIEHVHERVAATAGVDRCLVATDDARIADVVRSFGGEAVMTRADHPTGTDRIAETARLLGLGPDDLILNVQGDEPEIEPSYLERLIARMDAAGGPAAPMGTLAAPFPENLDPADPNCVKVVCDLDGLALYFSRSRIPYPRDERPPAGATPWLLHVGVYAYRCEFLQRFTGWAPTRLEQIEKLEQLRALEHGAAIAVVRVERALAGIDTPEDYARFCDALSRRLSGVFFAVSDAGCRRNCWSAATHGSNALVARGGGMVAAR